MDVDRIAQIMLCVRWSREDPTLPHQWRRGELVKLRSGHYVESSTWRDMGPHARFVATCIAYGRRSRATVFCCESALLLADIAVLGAPGRIQTLADDRGRAGRGRPSEFSFADARATSVPAPPEMVAHVHPPSRTANCAGLRLVEPLDAAVDVLSTASFQRGLVVADAILRAPRSIGALPCGHAPHVELFAGSPPPSGSEEVCAVQVMARRLHERTPAASRRRRALLALRHASPLAESPGESASRAILLAAGFPTPVLQAELRDHQGFIGRPDFWWPQQRIIGEFDGIAKYTDAGMTQGRSASSIIRAEKVREARLMALSNRLFRWEWGDVMHPERLVSKALAVGLEADPRRRFPGSGVPSRSS